MNFSTSIKNIIKHSAKILLPAVLYFTSPAAFAQNISGGEPVQWVGRPNAYNTEPYNSDYRTLAYRKVSTTAVNPTDGRGQWSTTINAQNSGGDIVPDNMPGGNGAGWLLISGPADNRLQHKWNFITAGQAALNAVSDVTLESGGQDMGLDMGATGYYTFNMNDAGYVNSQFYVGYTSNAPVTVNRLFDSLNEVTNGRVVAIGTSGTPSPEEKIYVRYVIANNDFTTGTGVVQASGADNAWFAEIPAVDCGTTVYYYIYTSTRTQSQTVADGESDRSLSAVRYDDNAGANYSYVANTALVIASPGAGGTIIPAGTTNFMCGSTVNYTITANDCKQIQDVLVDGVSVGPVNQYIFTGLTGNHTISAVFSAQTFMVSYSTSSGGGINTHPNDPGPDPLGSCGEDLVYNIYPDPCFSVANVLVDGVSVGAVNSYTFVNIHANHSLHVDFTATPYSIVVTNTTGGTILPGAGTVNCGDNAVYTISPNAGFTIQDVLVDGVSAGAVSTYTFTNVMTNHTITATYSENSFTITAGAGAHGTVTPSGVSSVAFGSNNTYTITPEICYHTEDVLVDGISVGPVSSYMFANTMSNHTISATFTLNAPLDAPVITGPTNICPYIGGTPVTFTALSAGAAGYNWVVPPTNVTIMSGQGTATLILVFQAGFALQANKQIRVTALSPCGNSPLTIKYLATQFPVTPSAILGNTNVCAIIGTANTYTYSIPPVLGAGSYNWSAQQSGAVTISHPNGAGVNDTTVAVSFATGFTTSNITVQAVNNCGVSGTRTITVSRIVPSTPSPISGPADVCENLAPEGTSATYMTSPTQGVTYNWTIPAGALGLTGQGTSAISFSFPAGFSSGTVSVVAANGCGISGTRSLNITTQLSAATSVITAVATTGCPDRVVTYSVTAIPSHATSVLWIVPAGGVIISGQGTTSITVSYPPTALNGTVTVQGTNNCGNGVVRSLAVHLTSCGDGPPPPPGPRTAKEIMPATANSAQELQVSVFPNPATTDFKLKVITAGKEIIRVRITDMPGRVVKNFIIMPFQTISVGSDFKTGTYVMEVRQANNLVMTKLLKF